jgi:hypothetical protein
MFGLTITLRAICLAVQTAPISTQKLSVSGCLRAGFFSEIEDRDMDFFDLDCYIPMIQVTAQTLAMARYISFPPCPLELCDGFPPCGSVADLLDWACSKSLDVMRDGTGE